MSITKEMKLHAKRFFFVTEEMNDLERRHRRSEMENGEIKAEYDRLVMEGIRKGYPTDTILQYMDEYQELTIGEYKEWLERD